MNPTKKMVNCPRCAKPAEYSESNESRPFCSQACKDGDIIAWADEEYKTPDRDASPEEIISALKTKL